MGTRNLTCVFVGGKYVVAQYGQWDGYPSCSGVATLAFLRGMDRAAFLERLKSCRFITDEERQQAWKDAGATSEWVSTEISNRFTKRVPMINRDHGTDILELIANSTGDIELGDSIDFASDSLFCEWAYVIDFDKNTFEVFKGFNKKPVPAGERFAHLEKDPPDREYFPIAHLATFALDAIPTDAEFLSKCEPREEEEAA